MQFPTIFRILGALLLIFSASLFVPICIAAYYQDGAEGSFLFSFILTVLTGSALWFRFKTANRNLRTREGFVIVGLFWAVLCLYAALPFWLSVQPLISFDVAVFEAVSGLTTTGACLLPELDHLPHALLFYRQELQFLGGMGVIVLAVAILPLLNVGGMQLYRAEMSGPLKESKLTPRFTQTAVLLWCIYLGLNIACIVSYSLAGMDLFDAICMAFSTVSTGGFSPHTANMAFYHSNLINSVAIVFMILGGCNFGLHFLVLRSMNPFSYWRNMEFRVFVCILLSCVVFCIVILGSANIYSHFGDLIIKPFFTVTSFLTTTGFVTTHYSHWPTGLICLLMFLSLIGACSGSTGGGIKVLRFTLWIKQGLSEIHQLIHPKGVNPVKIGHQSVSDRAMNSVAGFTAAYVGLLLLLTGLLCLTSNADILSAFGFILATLSNTGAVLGAAPNLSLASLDPLSHWICIIAMLAGRLEIFSLLILISPTFWRN